MDATASSPSEPTPGGERFSYTCHRCLKCCQHKLIQVNPYEVAQLSRHLGISTTEFIAHHLDGVFLRRRSDGTCEFLGPEGCTVHAARPLVCRLYPLGRHVNADGRVRFSHLTPHPESAGELGHNGTIDDFIAAQGAEPYIGAADRYLALLQKLYDAWREEDGKKDNAEDAVDVAETSSPDLMDVDKALAEHERRTGTPAPSDIESRHRLHIDLLTTQWLERAES